MRCADNSVGHPARVSPTNTQTFLRLAPKALNGAIEHHPRAMAVCLRALARWLECASPREEKERSTGRADLLVQLELVPAEAALVEARAPHVH